MKIARAPYICGAYILTQFKYFNFCRNIPTAHFKNRFLCTIQPSACRSKRHAHRNFVKLFVQGLGVIISSCDSEVNSINEQLKNVTYSVKVLNPIQLFFFRDLITRGKYLELVSTNILRLFVQVFFPFFPSKVPLLNRPSRVQYFIAHGVPYLFRVAASEINKWPSAYPPSRPEEIMRNNGALGCPAGPTRRPGSLKN